MHCLTGGALSASFDNVTSLLQSMKGQEFLAGGEIQSEEPGCFGQPCSSCVVLDEAWFR